MFIFFSECNQDILTSIYCESATCRDYRQVIRNGGPSLFILRLVKIILIMCPLTRQLMCFFFLILHLVSALLNSMFRTRISS